MATGNDDNEGAGAQHAEAREKFERTEKVVRRIGYVVLFGAVLLISVPMVVGAIQGLQTDEIWDPFTGEPVMADEVDVDCIDEAVHLTRHAEFDGEWERRFRRWRERCSDDYDSVYAMLNRVRDQLRVGDEPGDVNGEQDE